MLTTEPSDDHEPPPEVSDLQDLDPATWLARDESDVVGFVSVRGGRLKVAALTQREMDHIRRLSSRPHPRTKEPITDNILMTRRIIAFAISKAQGTARTPTEIQPEALDNKLVGELTEIGRQILKLSGFIADEERDDDLPFA